MEEKISFERYLFGDGNEIVIDDFEFCVDRIVMFPKIRPHRLEQAVLLSVKYCKSADFRRKLLEKSNECPVLIYHLHKRGVFVFEEIEHFLKNRGTFLLSYYFWKEIENFESFIQSKRKPGDYDGTFFENTNNIDQLVEYGYLPSSIEFCLKYDVIDDLVVFDNLNLETKWSPFEWSIKPQYLDLFSFTGFFGSIKCFKHLIMKGFEIKDDVLSMVVCSGCLDLFHLCQGQQLFTPESFYKVSEFCHLTLLVFMLDNGAFINANNKYGDTSLHFAASNGHLSVVECLVNHKADINAKTKDVEFSYLKRLLFIMLLKMDILVLLNILLIKKLI